MSEREQMKRKARWIIGVVAGVAGMLFSVPVASALRQLLREAAQWKEQRNAEKRSRPPKRNRTTGEPGSVGL